MRAEVLDELDAALARLWLHEGERGGDHCTEPAAGPLAGVRYAFLPKPFTAAAFDAAVARLLR